jgi:small subunit ribosomal protein S9
VPKPLIQKTGRRKEAVARVRLRAGSGVIKVNGRTFESYFPILTHRVVAIEALRLTQTADVYDVEASLGGGGVSGQAGALRLGIARALVSLDDELRPTLKKAGMLTRDAREKERRKYGLKKARKAPQYSKR